MTPAFLDGVLDAAGIDPAKLVLSLANNHILDQGIEGFDETVSALARARDQDDRDGGRTGWCEASRRVR